MWGHDTILVHDFKTCLAIRINGNYSSLIYQLTLIKFIAVELNEKFATLQIVCQRFYRQQSLSGEKKDYGMSLM